MKKKGSLGDFAISELCFAVYPLSLLLPSEPSNKLTFYFEKNLQIISKAQAPTHFSQQKGVISFPVPSNIQHFRTQSEKNLDYQFSLYLGDDQSEELVETQKVNLERVWTEYQLKKQTVHQNTVKFNKINGTLTYLITIGNNNEALLDNVKSYFRNSRSSYEQTEVQLPVSVEKSAEQAVAEKNTETPAVEIQNPSPRGKNRHAQIGEQYKISDVSNGSPQLNQQQENKQPISVNELIPELPLGSNIQTEQYVLQLSPSQRQLGNTIDIDVNESQVKQPGQTLQKQQQPSQQTERLVLKKINTQDGETPVTPTFPSPVSVPPSSSSSKKIRYAVLILIILALLGGGLLVGRKYSIFPSSLTKQKSQKVGKNKNKNRK